MAITKNPTPVSAGGSKPALAPNTIITTAINASRIKRMFFI